MCNILDTQVIIYNLISSDKPTFKEDCQFIANIAGFFFRGMQSFSKKEDFICKQSDTDIFQ